MDLKKKLKVTFAGEPGLDMGGLTKEWFLLLVRQIFQPEYGNCHCINAVKCFYLLLEKLLYVFHHCYGLSTFSCKTVTLVHVVCCRNVCLRQEISVLLVQYCTV